MGKISSDFNVAIKYDTAVRKNSTGTTEITTISKGSPNAGRWVNTTIWNKNGSSHSENPVYDTKGHIKKIYKIDTDPTGNMTGDGKQCR